MKFVWYLLKTHTYCPCIHSCISAVQCTNYNPFISCDLFYNNLLYYLVAGRTLTVNAVGLEDLGMYQCLVNTEEGSTQAAAQLKVSGKKD